MGYPCVKPARKKMARGQHPSLRVAVFGGGHHIEHKSTTWGEPVYFSGLSLCFLPTRQKTTLPWSLLGRCFLALVPYWRSDKNASSRSGRTKPLGRKLLTGFMLFPCDFPYLGLPWAFVFYRFDQTRGSCHPKSSIRKEKKPLNEKHVLLGIHQCPLISR